MDGWTPGKRFIRIFTQNSIPDNKAAFISLFRQEWQAGIICSVKIEYDPFDINFHRFPGIPFSRL